MKYFQFAVILIAYFINACQPSNQVDLTEEDIKAIEQVTQVFQNAENSNDWSNIAEFFSADAILMPPNGVAIQGIDNIRKYFESFPAVTFLKLENIEVKGFGDYAYTYGRYALKGTLPEDDPVTDEEKYLEIRQKQADGSWLIYREMFNSDMAQPE
ncbi:MAG: SgcJ/EcaC family oxidoreductase [Ignavibacterium sp.]|nr:MAG: SgcJ/EcaC family oxidoreductase [Ignavibacterium sp.]